MIERPIRNLILIPFLLLCLATQARSDTSPQIATQTQLSQVIAQLNKPQTKMAALKELIAFARFKVISITGFQTYYGVKDPAIHALQLQAEATVESHEDVDTVGQALNTSDELLLNWAVRVFPALTTYPKPDHRWLILLPKIEQEAGSANSGIRREVYEKLAYDQSEIGLLMNRLTVETDPANIIDLIYDTKYPTYSPAEQALFLTYFDPLLQSKDPDVRLNALDFIWLNNQDAPIYQVTFDDVDYDRVAALTHSTSKMEQRIAGYALEAIQRQRAPTAKPTNNR